MQDYQLLAVYNCDDISQEEAYELFPGDFNSKKQPRVDRPNRGHAASAFDKNRTIHASIKAKGRTKLISFSLNPLLSLSSVPASLFLFRLFSKPSSPPLSISAGWVLGSGHGGD